MQIPCAIIDLGSNTFHLLIGKIVTGGHLEELFKQRVYVKLAEDGLECIGAVPFERGIKTLEVFRAAMDLHGVERYWALGTATLRKASNANTFIALAKDRSNIDIQVIDGQEEALLIYEGVCLAAPKDELCNVAMDIGGGSVELMLFQKGQLLWRESFPVGVALLKNVFQTEGALKQKERKAIEKYLEVSLQPYLKTISRFNPDRLIGASGTFEVLDDAIGIGGVEVGYRKLMRDAFEPIALQVLSANVEELRNIPWIPEERIDLIQIAFVLMKWVIDHSEVRELGVSRYAMKEGALFRLSQ